jgi:hypothetical protein
VERRERGRVRKSQPIRPSVSSARLRVRKGRLRRGDHGSRLPATDPLPERLIGDAFR